MPKKSFKQYNQGQDCLFPRSPDEMILADSPARLVSQIVDNLDIMKVIDTYTGGGTSSYHPRMMLKIILFACLNNIYSCRKIENANGNLFRKTKRNSKQKSKKYSNRSMNVLHKPTIPTMSRQRR
jgi:transposase